MTRTRTSSATIHMLGQPRTESTNTNHDDDGIAVGRRCQTTSTSCSSTSGNNRYETDGWHENSPWPTSTPPAILVKPSHHHLHRRSSPSPYSDEAAAGELAHFIHHENSRLVRSTAASSFEKFTSPSSLGQPSDHHSQAFDSNYNSTSPPLIPESPGDEEDMAMLFPWTFFFRHHPRPQVRKRFEAPDASEIFDDQVWPYGHIKNASISPLLYDELADVGSGESSLSDYYPIRNATTIDYSLTTDSIAIDRDLWEFNFVMHGVIMPLIAIFGVLANLVSFVVLTRHAMRSSVINVYLAALSAFDGLLLLITLLLYPPMSYCEWYGGNDVESPWCRYFFHSSLITYPLSLITQSGSVWTLVAITIDRFIAITWPLASRKWMTNRRALIVVAIIIFWSIVYNIPTFFELKLTNVPIDFDDDKQPIEWVTVLDRTEMRTNWVYIRAYKGYCYLIFMLLLPAGLMIGLNAYIAVAVRRASRVRRRSMNVQASTGRDEKERRCTLMAILVVGTFLVLNFLAFVNNMLEGLVWTEEDLTKRSFLTLVCVGNVLVALNSATNFFIYCALGLRFRQMFCKLFCPWCYTPEREYQYLSVYYGSGRNYCWTNGGGGGAGGAGGGGGGSGRAMAAEADSGSALLGGGIISMRTLPPTAGKQPRTTGSRSNISPPTVASAATNRSPQRMAANLTPAGTRISSPVSGSNAGGARQQANVVRFASSQGN